MHFCKLGVIFNEQSQLPTLQDRGEQIRVYYSYIIKKQSFINYIEISKKNFKISYKNKKPVLCPGSVGCFDDAGVMPSCVAGNMLIYTGWSLRKTVPYSHAIGHAVFDEKKNKFERLSKGPIFDKEEKIPYLANSGFIFNGKMFFCNGTGWTGTFPKYDIYCAEKAPNWRVGNSIFCEKGAACSRPFVNEQGLFFSKKKKKTNYKIYHYNYKKITMILDKSNYGWDSEMVCYPYLFGEMLFYNGNGYGKTGFGVAILDSI